MPVPPSAQQQHFGRAHQALGFPCQLFFFSFFFSLKAGPVSKQEFTSLLQLLLELRGLKQSRKHFWEQPLGRDREHPDLLTSHQLHLVLQEDAGLEGNRSWCLSFAPQICRAPAQPGATPRGWLRCWSAFVHLHLAAKGQKTAWGRQSCAGS